MSESGTMTASQPRKKSLRKRAAKILILPLVAIPLVLVSCVRSSGGAWYFDSAPLPEGWPELTPVGKVEIREYPSYRAAVVTEEEDLCLSLYREFNPCFSSTFKSSLLMYSIFYSN